MTTATLSSPVNMTSVFAFLVIYAVFSVTMFMLEMYFIRKGNKLLKLLPPVITFVPTVPYLLYSINGASLGLSGSAVLAFATLLTVLNINTIIIIRYARKRSKKW